MLIEERYNEILKMIEQNNSVEVSDLAKNFAVSIETIRRDLKYLESKKALKRVHGGAVSVADISPVSDRISRQSIHWEEKLEIGENVCRHLTDGQVIAIDSGTTCHAVSQVIKTHFSKLTVITNYIPIICELAENPGINIIVPGGMLRNAEMAVVGQQAIDNISNIHIDIALLSISGISLENGLSDFGLDEITVKKAILNVSDIKYILADSSKFDKKSMTKVCEIGDIDAIFTDSKLNALVKKQYEKRKVRIINK